MAQISTAISDFVLCLSSFYGAGVLYQGYIHASFGLALVGIAAGVGTIRFLNLAPFQRRNAVVSLHSKLSWLATILGLPLIAASFCLKFSKTNSSHLHIISAIAGIILFIIFPKFQDAFTRFPSTMAIFSILFQCYQADNMMGVVGAALYALSGTLIGTLGYIVGMRRIDVFHYCLVIGNIAFFKALLKL